LGELSIFCTNRLETETMRQRHAIAETPAPLLAALPAGVATYSLRHGYYEWQPGTKPITQMNPDWDMFWVRDGVAQWEFTGGQRVVAKKDQFLILPPFTAAVVSEVRSPMAFWYCHFGFRPAPANINDRWTDDFRRTSARTMVPLTFSRAEAPAVWAAYRDLIRVPAQSDVPWRLERAVITLVANLVTFAHARQPATTTSSALVSRRDPRVETLCTRITQNPAHPWRVAALAAAVGLSVGRLNSVFRTATGTSLKHFIVTARLRVSLRLLRDYDQGRPPSVRDVAESCGFSSQHFFCRQFKAYFGLAPLAYRNGGPFA